MLVLRAPGTPGGTESEAGPRGLWMGTGHVSRPHQVLSFLCAFVPTIAPFWKNSLTCYPVQISPSFTHPVQIRSPVSTFSSPLFFLNDAYSQYFYLCIYSFNGLPSASIKDKLQEDKEHVVCASTEDLVHVQ